MPLPTRGRYSALPCVSCTEPPWHKAESMLKKVKRKFAQLTLSGDRYARYVGVSVGTGCRILTHAFGSEPFLISIGNNVTVSHGVIFVNHDGAGWLIKDEKGRRYAYRRIKIGNNCFIGASSIIMPGVEIGNNVIIAAGAVVTKSIPDQIVAGGNPIKYLMSFDDFKLKALAWSSENDLDLISGSHHQRVTASVDETTKPYLRIPA